MEMNELFYKDAYLKEYDEKLKKYHSLFSF